VAGPLTGATLNIYPLNKFGKAFHPKKKNEQTHITTILSDMDARIATLEKQLEKARQIKKGMMHPMKDASIINQKERLA